MALLLISDAAVGSVAVWSWWLCGGRSEEVPLFYPPLYLPRPFFFFNEAGEKDDVEQYSASFTASASAFFVVVSSGLPGALALSYPHLPFLWGGAHLSRLRREVGRGARR